jgi:hypothetical protein
MIDEAEKTLVRIEASLDRLLAHLPDSDEYQTEQIDRIEALLEKLLNQAEKQTALLEKLYANDRARG